MTELTKNFNYYNDYLIEVSFDETQDEIIDYSVYHLRLNGSKRELSAKMARVIFNRLTQDDLDLLREKAIEGNDPEATRGDYLRDYDL